MKLKEFVANKISEINSSFIEATKKPNNDYKQLIKILDDLGKEKISKEQFEQKKKELIYDFNGQHVKNYLLEKFLKKIKNKKNSISLFDKFKDKNFIKSKITEIANEEFIYKSDLQNFYAKKIFNDLSISLEIKNLSNKIFELIKVDSKLGENKFKFISNDLKKFLPFYMFHILNNGFPINIQGINSGIMNSNAGDSGEHFFVARAILAGFDASVVDVRTSSYDAIIDINGRLLKVQIKSFDSDSFSRRSRDRGGQGVDHNDPSNRGKLVTSKDCDLFAIILKKTGTVYIFVKQEIDRLPEKNFKAEKYPENLENWESINLA